MAIVVVGAYVAMALPNFLASKKVFGGKTNKDISDSYPTYVTPDGATFAVWGLIYLFLLVTAVAQVAPSSHMEAILSGGSSWTGLDVRTRLALAFLVNGLWLPVFSFERFWFALGIMAVYLALLVSIYADLNMATLTASESLIFATGVAMNTSWIVVAFAVNAFVCGAVAGWTDEHNVAGSMPVSVAVVTLVTALGCERAIASCDLAWSFVAAWALRGIYRMQSIPDAVRFPLAAMSSNLATSARIGSFAVVAAGLASAAWRVYLRVSAA
eukprot:CAMPEP_0117526648 /NCGR_PEP_ID=MMETSP0784-20121206/36390_1 /TAXON_ID=39447 /ORGANISM="" /LENGTH=269 /DNA_ID=CAMNT_0005322875 /DNA_START=78 /DNA_END=887 /DNA_ORIENTATION=+